MTDGVVLRTFFSFRDVVASSQEGNAIPIIARPSSRMEYVILEYSIWVARFFFDDKFWTIPDVYGMIVKTNDDLRQEYLAFQVR